MILKREVNGNDGVSFACFFVQKKTAERATSQFKVVSVSRRKRSCFFMLLDGCEFKNGF
jgi:hypothetical protein